MAKGGEGRTKGILEFWEKRSEDPIKIALKNLPHSKLGTKKTAWNLENIKV